MAKKLKWEPHNVEGAKLRTGALTLYVDPGEGGFRYRVAGKWLLRYSVKPVPTLARAQTQCLKAAARLLRDELASLEVITAEPATRPAV